MFAAMPIESKSFTIVPNTHCIKYIIRDEQYLFKVFPIPFYIRECMLCHNTRNKLTFFLLVIAPIVFGIFLCIQLFTRCLYGYYGRPKVCAHAHSPLTQIFIRGSVYIHKYICMYVFFAFC